MSCATTIAATTISKAGAMPEAPGLDSASNALAISAVREFVI